jgi:AcrR family transcriptional regulator
MSSPRPHPNPELDSVSSTRAKILAAALALVLKRGDASVTMADIAKAAHLSRQAVYLHFADRADLMVALVQHVDEKRGMAAEIRKVAEAPTGRDALREMASLQARMNPAVWAAARAVDAVRRTDRAAERSWQDRLKHRLDGCATIVSRLVAEGELRDGLDPGAATDLLWVLTSLRVWEDLVLERGWSAEQYFKHTTEVLSRTLCKPGTVC